MSSFEDQLIEAKQNYQIKPDAPQAFSAMLQAEKNLDNYKKHTDKAIAETPKISAPA